MRRVLRGFAGVVLALVVALPAIAATPAEFYLAMLRKGVGAYDGGRFESAAGSLKIAAFGLIESIEHYQTAQVYLALTYDRLGNAEQAREAARRVVIAQRIESRYGSLQLPAATRANFEALARRALTPADLTILSKPAEGPTTTPVPTPVKTEPVVAKPQPAPAKPEPAKQNPAPAPVKTEPAPVKNDPPVVKNNPPVVKNNPPVVKNDPPPKKVDPPAPKPQPPAPAPAATTRAPINVAASFAAAEEALTAARLVDARAIYRQILDSASLQRADLLRVAEGFYRARDFPNALRAFERIGALRRGEEPYRYYIAVSYYETGQYRRAKDELTTALPFIEQTPDVTRYKVKIEGALN